MGKVGEGRGGEEEVAPVHELMMVQEPVRFFM